ncbi:transposable element Tc1 transposase [Trichonephila clavipes]|nr:transposable element Tc1 transposase [Trichonephila clavipes]
MIPKWWTFHPGPSPFKIFVSVTGATSSRSGSGWQRGTTERKEHRIQRTAVTHRMRLRQKFELQFACIPLTPNHCRLRCQWCQAKAHWRTEWRSPMFFDESKFCLCASDGDVLVRRRPGEPSCLRPRHTGPTPEIMV